MTAAGILKKILSYLTDYETSVGSFPYDFARAVSEEMSGVYNDNENTLKNAFALTAEGEFLDKKVAEQAIERKQAQYAKGFLTIKGTKGAVIRTGSKAASGDLLFSVSKNAIIPESGIIDVPVVCDTPGTVGNVVVNSVTRFPVTLPGLSEVTNKDAFTGGADEETDDELRSRYFAKVSRPNTSGNKYHYETWAKSVPDVGAVKVVPLANGPGTVKVIISDSANQPAGTGIIESVKAVIEENRPIGASVEVVSSKALNISVAADIKYTGNLDTVIREVSEAISSYFSKTAAEKGVVSYAKIGSIILADENVEDYENLTVNGGTENIFIADEYVPVLTEVRHEA